MLRTSPVETADEIDHRIAALASPSTASIRGVRREYSKALRESTGAEVLAIAGALLDRHRWVAYELIYHHPSALSDLDDAAVEQLGAGLDGWVAVDSFARYLSGPAWQRGVVSDDLVRSWTTSPDRWWRRAALVSTVPLNLRAAGGSGDAARTLDIGERLVDDRDDMVVKGLSWALRELIIWDADAVRSFLDTNRGRLAARIRREVTSKLETGRKQRRR